MQWTTVSDGEPPYLSAYGVPTAVIAHHPGGWASIAAIIKSLYLAGLSGLAGISIFGADTTGSERSAWIVVGGGGVIWILSKLIDLYIKFRKDIIAVEAGTAQEAVEKLKDRLAESETRREQHMRFAAEAIARGDALQKQLDRANQLYHELMDDLRSARREADAARAEANQTSRLIAEKLPAAPPAEPIKIAIDPASEPVPVKEVNGGGAG